MNIKKVIAPTMSEAMKKVKMELGENAVILNSKVIFHGGFFGLFRKKSIEVIAALDEQPMHVQQTRKNKNRKIPNTGIKPSDLSSSNQKVGQKDTDILSEISELKSEIKAMKKSNQFYNQYPERIQKYLFKLIEEEVNEAFVLKIGEVLLEKWRNSDKKPSDLELSQWCETFLINQLSHVNFNGISYKKKFVNFVGPTGVGKTTTIAKLAAEAVLEHKKKVALITTDTYRIAAIDQLKTYAQLLNIPVEVVYEEDDFHSAVIKYEDYDIVLIDTAGRNYQEKQYIHDLQSLFGDETNIETYLVLSISMKEKDIERIIENFLELNFNQFIFTKADETRSFGIMYNLICKYKVGAAYITTGQDVPDDIIAATPKVITEYLLRDELS
ncbi:flagellar biosynthesis protein FlhF [Lederbergia wuyishanensis]|uniref:Flagellar biosynthesis protein FlhF n=1 Tax=Lederbergia wuyishanensis TaxID=1347903 RepID=A0ABU0CZT1_9BACI|nr:flagellar biosynthesis protein FlhF [Lederbergia wuyishanensis]MCJ8006282.1 flagellar biosynthesis protein FlhF [Lederbergia wuyishanensis]MDQ0341651.1 flagellar biosynthesis protein FlhF [Lederbergia wuyishanensis]